MKKVESRRDRIYQYILSRIGAGISPTVREICEDLNIASTSTVHSDLHHLMDMGYIEMEEGRNRTIRLPGDNSVRVPLVGTVTAGVPILAVENIESYIPVALSASSDRDLFALHVRGDSMKNAAIIDGDIVVALIDDEATVKRYFRENGAIRLQPENDAYEPIVSDEIELIGRVVSVMRFL